MELLSLLMVFAALAAVMAFLVFYRSWLIEQKSINPLFIGRIAAIGITGVLCALRNQDHPASFIMIILFILTLLVVWALNTQTAASAFHGFFMTIWQFICLILIIFIIYYIHQAIDNLKKDDKSELK